VNKDMESFVSSQQDTKVGKLRGNWRTHVYLEKLMLKQSECVYVPKVQ